MVLCRKHDWNWGSNFNDDYIMHATWTTCVNHNLVNVHTFHPSFDPSSIHRQKDAINIRSIISIDSTDLDVVASVLHVDVDD